MQLLFNLTFPSEFLIEENSSLVKKRGLYDGYVTRLDLLSSAHSFVRRIFASFSFICQSFGWFNIPLKSDVIYEAILENFTLQMNLKLASHSIQTFLLCSFSWKFVQQYFKFVLNENHKQRNWRKKIVWKTHRLSSELSTSTKMLEQNSNRSRTRLQASIDVRKLLWRQLMVTMFPFGMTYHRWDALLIDLGTLLSPKLLICVWVRKEKKKLISICWRSKAYYQPRKENKSSNVANANIKILLFAVSFGPLNYCVEKHQSPTQKKGKI